MSQEDDRLYAGVAIGETIYNEERGTRNRARDRRRVLRAHPGRCAREDAYRGARTHGADYITWRYWECGAMDKIEASLPSKCHECGAPREELYYWVED